MAVESLSIRIEYNESSGVAGIRIQYLDDSRDLPVLSLCILVDKDDLADGWSVSALAPLGPFQERRDVVVLECGPKLIQQSLGGVPRLLESLTVNCGREDGVRGVSENIWVQEVGRA